jgi:hypothetical protein
MRRIGRGCEIGRIEGGSLARVVESSPATGFIVGIPAAMGAEFLVQGARLIPAAAGSTGSPGFETSSARGAGGWGERLSQPLAGLALGFRRGAMVTLEMDGESEGM